jgi:hypothetical protein
VTLVARHLAAIVACGALLVLAGCGSSEDEPGRAAAADVSTPAFVGISSEDVFAGSDSYRRRQLAAQVRSGIGLVRQKFAWSDMERDGGELELGRYDRYVAATARAGLTVMPILFDPPLSQRRAPAPTATATTTAPPRSFTAMARWAQALVRRYGTEGSFWRAHPELPRRPIIRWQVWNEPNLPAYWNAAPNAREYVRMLKVVGSAIREADPRALVVTAGMPESRLGIPFDRFLREMYAADAAGSFDVLAINAYSTTARGIVVAVAGARRITAAAADGDVPIMLTEFGWATRPSPRGSFTVSRRRQARLVSSTIARLEAERERLRIAGVVYYQWRDAPVYPGGRDFWGLHTGLLDIDGRPKPALRQFARVARTAG